MVTLVIIVVMSTLDVVSMDKALSEARLRTGCRLVVSAMIYARSSAVAHRTYTQVVFDRVNNAVSVQSLARDERGEERMTPLTTPSGRYRRLPRGVEIVRVKKPETEEEETFVLSETDLGKETESLELLDETAKMGAPKAAAPQAAPETPFAAVYPEAAASDKVTVTLLVITVVTMAIGLFASIGFLLQQGNAILDIFAGGAK